MTITNSLASLAVRDLDAAVAWYETLLGPSRRPMPEVAEWQLERGGGLQVYLAPERAGLGSCTLVVTDVDEIAEQLRRSGLAPDAEPVHRDRVDTVMITDPDGNSIAFAHPKDQSLAR
jgi:predicted enzyme related to lactoylglutathione lyase